MIIKRLISLSFLLLLAGCQSFWSNTKEPSNGETRWQGELLLIQNQLWLRPCQEQRRFLLQTDPAFTQDAYDLFVDAGEPRLFADIQGYITAPAANSPAGEGGDGQLRVTRFYKLQPVHAQSCLNAKDQSLMLQASGNLPAWSMTITSQGLLLKQEGQPAQALPYLEEQLPGDQLSFSSAANGLQIELWVSPQRCLNPQQKTLTHLSASLQINGQVHQGCAYFGEAKTRQQP